MTAFLSVIILAIFYFNFYNTRKCNLKLSCKEKKEIFFLFKLKHKQKDYNTLPQYFSKFKYFFNFLSYISKLKSQFKRICEKR